LNILEIIGLGALIVVGLVVLALMAIYVMIRLCPDDCVGPGIAPPHDENDDEPIGGGA
jgi:hypothetical protein